MKTIGILGGLGPESTALYYNYITRKYYELYSDYAYPEIIIHSLNFKEYIETGYKSPFKIKKAIEGLKMAGADFVVAACNSIHIVYEEVYLDIPIPWISIMDAVAQEIKKKGLHKIGLLGTIFTMENDFYKNTFDKYNIELIVPLAASQEKVNEIIYKELITAIVQNDSKQIVLEIIDELESNGAQGIILGCTELPLLIKEDDIRVDLFNSTSIHAQKALNWALC